MFVSVSVDGRSASRLNQKCKTYGGEWPMSDKDFEVLREQLASFTRLLDEKITEFQDRGGFSDTHEAFVERVKQGQAAVEAKLESAVRAGAPGAATKHEIERDLNALIQDFGHLEERLRAESMKH
jgi:hypothetical protein